VVTAWYEERRDREIVSIDFAPSLPQNEIGVVVRKGEELNPDRAEFRSKASVLWPDDKWNNRVVHRYRRGTATGSFLIDVRVAEETIDFYHESTRPPEAEAPLQLPPPTVALQLPRAFQPEFDAYRKMLEEIRTHRQELENADLHGEDKDALRRYLDKLAHDAQRKYLSPSAGNDFFTPRR
jgi:hypothetical protein